MADSIFAPDIKKRPPSEINILQFPSINQHEETPELLPDLKIQIKPFSELEDVNRNSLSSLSNPALNNYDTDPSNTEKFLPTLPTSQQEYKSDSKFYPFLENSSEDISFNHSHFNPLVSRLKWDLPQNINETADGCPRLLVPWHPLEYSGNPSLAENRLCVSGCCQPCGFRRK